MEKTEQSFPFVSSDVFQTEKGALYLQAPGAAVLAAPDVRIEGLRSFLKSFPDDLHFDDYLADPTKLTPTETLCKVAGQLCYLSFGPVRSMNADADKYFLNIKESGHGSVLEHANFTVLWWGVSRSITHELVRHRAGFGFSQVSQRYVGGKTLRFVERPEYVGDPFMHERFQRWIEAVRDEYDFRTEYLMQRQSEGSKILSAESKTDLRKKVRGAARSVLGNETEAPILITANVRAWRHLFNMRASEHAEVEIRRAAYQTFKCLNSMAPTIFSDFADVELGDGTMALSTPFPKV